MYFATLLQLNCLTNRLIYCLILGLRSWIHIQILSFLEALFITLPTFQFRHLVFLCVISCSPLKVNNGLNEKNMFCMETFEIHLAVRSLVLLHCLLPSEIRKHSCAPMFWVRNAFFWLSFSHLFCNLFYAGDDGKYIWRPFPPFFLAFDFPFFCCLQTTKLHLRNEFWNRNRLGSLFTCKDASTTFTEAFTLFYSFCLMC